MKELDEASEAYLTGVGDGRRFGTWFERERIIKLLEPYANNKCDEVCAGGCDCFGKYEAEHFIALIKGENK